MTKSEGMEIKLFCFFGLVCESVKSNVLFVQLAFLNFVQRPYKTRLLYRLRNTESNNLCFLRKLINFINCRSLE